MPEPSPDPNLDSMFDYKFDDPPLHTDTMEEEPTEDLHDDEMIDEDTVIRHPIYRTDDLNMESFPRDPEHLGDDDDILYEEDEQEVATEGGAKTGADQVQTVDLTAYHEFTLAPEEPLQTAPPTQEQEDLAENQIDVTTEILTEAEGEGRGDDEEHNDIAREPNDRSTQPAEFKTSVDGSHLVESASVELTSDALTKDTRGPASHADAAQADYQDAKQETIAEIESHPTDTETDQGKLAVSGITTTEVKHLHPIKVIYQDSEICLFPPMHDDNSDTFFLSDTNLAYENLDRLLAACREVLAGTIGDDDELVLDVASLGLHICEDSKYATQITLSQVLDVYLALSHNEHVESIEPLYCALSSRVCLASQYAYLTNSAQEGRTFTEISTEHLGSPDESENDFEEENDAESLQYVSKENDAFGDPANSNEDAALHDHPLDNSAIRKAMTEDEQFDVHDEGERQNLGEVSSELDENAGHESGDFGDHQAEQPDGYTVRNDEQDFADQQQTTLGDHTQSGANEDECAGEADADPITRFDTGPATVEFSESTDPIEDVHAPDENVKLSRESELAETFNDTSVQGETSSSHTVEGDRESFSHPSPTEDEFLADDDDHQDSEQIRNRLTDEGPTDLDAQELREHGGAGAAEVQNNDRQDDQAELNITGEDDILDLEIDRQDHVDRHRNSFVEEDEQEDLFSESETVDNGETPIKNGLSTNGRTTTQTPTPSTPSKGNPAKRKIADDDDELDLLDISTPDLKRRRPS